MVVGRPIARAVVVAARLARGERVGSARLTVHALPSSPRPRRAATRPRPPPRPPPRHALDPRRTTDNTRP
jgi:hypothetical protein